MHRGEEGNSSTTEDSHQEDRSPADHAEIFSFNAPWNVYATGFSVSPAQQFRLAISSFIEDPNNYIEVLSVREGTGQFAHITTFPHLYPPSKVMFVPDVAGTQPDLIASSGDGVRVWLVGDDMTLKAHLQSGKSSEFGGPLTAFDWNVDDLSLLGASSIDTTVTLWDLEKAAVRSQLIAHEKEVFDFGFAKGTNEFATVSADGSLRLFDLRRLEQPTVVFENADGTPMLRLAWNKVEKNYIAALSMDSSVVQILDIRSPSVPVLRLSGHQSSVNALDWAPHSSAYIATAGDDSQVLIWDLMRPRTEDSTDPALAYTAGGEVSSLQWASVQPELLSIAFKSTVQVLKV